MKLKEIFANWKKLTFNLKLKVLFYLYTLLNAAIILVVALVPSFYFEHPIFRIFTFMTTGVFFIEYIWNITQIKHKFKYIYSFAGIIQLLSIVPIVRPEAMAFRLIKVLIGLNTVRNLNLEQQNTVTLGNQIKGAIKREKALLIKSFFILIVLMIFSAFAVFSFEHAAQPEKFKNLFDAVWWSFQTGSTVGYGDIVPITVPGRLVAMVLSILGIASFSILTTIISTGFIQKNRMQKIVAEIENQFKEMRDHFYELSPVESIERLTELLKNKHTTEAEYETLKKAIIEKSKVDNKKSAPK